jgi:hypothetical protein
MTTPTVPWQDIALGLLLVVLGCSFAYKFFLATVFGRVSYWTGFLPLTLLSPFFIHIPGSKRSLIRYSQGLWVNLLMGPVFLILSVLLIAAGIDIAGFPGTDSLNFLLNHGEKGRSPSIIFDKTHHVYRFPFLDRSYKLAKETFDKWQVPLAEKEKLLEDKH